MITFGDFFKEVNIESLVGSSIVSLQKQWKMEGRQFPLVVDVNSAHVRVHSALHYDVICSGICDLYSKDNSNIPLRGCVFYLSLKEVPDTEILASLFRIDDTEEVQFDARIVNSITYIEKSKTYQLNENFQIALDDLQYYARTIFRESLRKAKTFRKI